MPFSLSAFAGAGQQFFTDNGTPLAGGKIFVYAAGTTTPQTAYTTRAGNTPLSNPIILNSAGRVPTGEIWLDDNFKYKFVVKTSDDTLIATYDDVEGVNSSTAADITYTPPFSGGVTTTVSDKLSELVSVNDFGAIGDGIVDDTAAFSNAAAYLDGAAMYLPPKTSINLNSNPPNAPVWGAGSVKFDSYTLSGPDIAGYLDRSSLSLNIGAPTSNAWLYTEFPAASGQANVRFGAGISTKDDATFVRNTVLGSMALTNPVSSERTEAIGQGALRWAKWSERNTAIGSLSMQWLGQPKSELQGLFHDLYYPIPPSNPSWNVNGFETRNPGIRAKLLVVSDATSSTDVSRNVGVGRDSLVELINGYRNTAIGYRALGWSFSATENTAVGYEALTDNLLGRQNSGFGYWAGHQHQEGERNVFVGHRAGETQIVGNRNTYLGAFSGDHPTSTWNNVNDCVLIGAFAGYTTTPYTEAFVVSTTSAGGPLFRGTFGTQASRFLYVRSAMEVSFGNSALFGDTAPIARFSSTESGPVSLQIFSRGSGGAGWNTADACVKVGTMQGTSRSINAGGTINASGADYAEYFELTPALYGKVKPGALLGVDKNGLLTDVYDDVVGPFFIKSTHPNLVGNDTWGSVEAIEAKYGVKLPGDRPAAPTPVEVSPDETPEALELRRQIYAQKKAEYDLKYASWQAAKKSYDAALETERARWDRIALCGQTPANLFASSDNIGFFVVPAKAEDGKISAIFVRENDLVFADYKRAIGRVIRIADDNRPIVLV